VARGSIGNLKNLNFLIDTGAVPAVLDERIARKLHLDTQGEQIDVFTKKLQTKQAIAPDVRLGPLHAGELRAAVLDLSFEREAVGTKVDAIVGYDLLGQGPFTIDYEARKITVGPIDPLLARIPYHPDFPFAALHENL
jgi:Aspartyl protease